MARTFKSKTNTTKAAEKAGHKGGKTKRVIIKDLQQTKAGEKVVGGMLGQRES